MEDVRIDNLAPLSASRPSRRRFLSQAARFTAGSMAALGGLAAAGDVLALHPSFVAATSSPKKVTLGLSGKSRSLAHDYFGYNASAVWNVAGGWTNASLIKQTKSLRPQTLRYPAGTVANYWDWHQGWFVSNANLNPPSWTQGIPKVPMGISDFQKAIKSIGATPIFVLNLLSSTVDDQIAMLSAAKGLGLPITYVELGNEFYLPQRDNIAQFPTAADYATTASQWAGAIRARFPGVKIAAVGAVTPQAGSIFDRPRIDSWNSDLLGSLKGVDALTFHAYPSYETTAVPKSMAVSTSNVGSVIGAPLSEWSSLHSHDLSALPSGMEAWITEYNEGRNGTPIYGTWIHALFVTLQSLTFLGDSRITHIVAHSLVSTSVEGALFIDNNSLTDADPGLLAATKTTSTKPFDVSAMGTCLYRLSEALNGMTSVQQLSFSPNSKVDGYDVLVGWVFGNGHNYQMIVLNLSGSTMHLTSGKHGGLLPVKVHGKAKYEQLSAGPLSLIASAGQIAHKSGTLGSTLSLAPYSLTRIYS